MNELLSAAEVKAIRLLKRAARAWPPTLWLFSASGSLIVMRTGINGEHVVTPDGTVDHRYTVDAINIPNDGGDW